MTLKTTPHLFIVLTTLFTAFASMAASFPTFNRQADITRLMYTALTTDGNPKVITLDHKKFRAEVSIGTFNVLFNRMRFKDVLYTLKPMGVSENDMKALLKFYHRGFTSPTLTFSKDDFLKAIKDIKPKVKPRDADITKLLDLLHTLATTDDPKTGAKKYSAAAIAELAGLTDLDHQSLFKKVLPRHTKDVQKYRVILDTEDRPFTLKKVKDQD